MFFHNGSHGSNSRVFGSNWGEDKGAEQAVIERVGSLLPEAHRQILSSQVLKEVIMTIGGT